MPIRATGTQLHWRALLTELTTKRPKKSPNLPPPANGPVHTEFRILKHVVVSAAEVEVGVLFHNGQTEVPLQITLNELDFTLPPTPIKIYNSVAKSIVTSTVRQKRSKAMHM